LANKVNNAGGIGATMNPNLSDADEFRRQAEDAQKMATRTSKQADKVFWLQAEDWAKLSQEADEKALKAHHPSAVQVGWVCAGPLCGTVVAISRKSTPSKFVLSFLMPRTAHHGPPDDARQHVR
jgi:hypothetical protein